MGNKLNKKGQLGIQLPGILVNKDESKIDNSHYAQQKATARSKNAFSGDPVGGKTGKKGQSGPGVWLRAGDKSHAKHLSNLILASLKKQPKPNLPKSEEGINQPVKAPHLKGGMSKQGLNVRVSNDLKNHPAGKEALSDAKAGHKKVISELKSQPKPNLPKSEKNPDERADAVLGENVENLVHEHEESNQDPKHKIPMKKNMPATVGDGVASSMGGEDMLMSEGKKKAVKLLSKCLSKSKMRKAESLKKEHLGFEKLKNKIAAHGGAKDPAAVAAAIGRKKYGKAAFQAKAAAGHKKSELEKAKRDSQKEIKGVHTSGGFSGLEEKGQSQAGRNIERAKEKQPNKYLNDLYQERGKHMHREKLEELKSMPKPNLPKSEDASYGAEVQPKKVDPREMPKSKTIGSELKGMSKVDGSVALDPKQKLIACLKGLKKADPKNPYGKVIVRGEPKPPSDPKKPYGKVIQVGIKPPGIQKK